MTQLNDYATSAATYDAARALALEGLGEWREAVRTYVDQMVEGLPILDLGCGTGQFAVAFAEWFDRPIVGVEPSAEMREQARAKVPPDRATFLAGEASSIPMEGASCGLAWLSTVIHHFPDLDAAAGELQRVLAPQAHVLIRGAFPGRHEGITVFRYFSEGTRVLEKYPTVEATRLAFEHAGFRFVRLAPVRQRTADSLAAVRERVSHRNTDTIIRGLTDAEYAAGLARIDAELAEGDPGAQFDDLDLLVFQRD